MSKNKLRIALISDYFYPSKGGVETHIKTVGEELFKMGHHVIVITHKYNNFSGFHKIDNLLVYYLDVPLIAKNTSFPTLFTNYILFRDIFEYHEINIAHGHQSLSNLCMEGLFHASHLNIKTILTDHSVFEIAKAERILVNNLSSFICKNIDWAVCVSQVSKHNTHIRTGIPLEKISVIPNGIIPEKFYPLKKTRTDKFKMIYMSRLTFRKGVDLLVDAMPLLCKNEKLNILIVGDGPKKSDLLQVIDENDLHDQVSIVPEINYEEVGDILRTGDVFLNTSLTETFCLANLEAAACGLIVVSTNVGGVSEVLEGESILFCRPTGNDIRDQVEKALDMIPTYDPFNLQNTILKKFTWQKVAKATEELYLSVPSKILDFKTSILQYQEPNQFLCRLGIWFEYLQINFFKFLDK